jgi:uncharacterized repeat protein (TIGR02543 family)
MGKKFERGVYTGLDGEIMVRRIKNFFRLRMVILLLLAFGILPVFFSLAYGTETYDVSVTQESGLINALANPAAEVILIESDITLVSTLTVTRSVRLIGAGKGITLTAASGTRHIYVTAENTELIFSGVTLDGGGDGGGIAYDDNFSDTVPSKSVIKGAHIINCSWPIAGSGKGGAVMSGFGDSHDLRLEDCVITDNLAGSNGGGVYGYAAVELENCVVTDNVSTDEQGGGVYARLNITVLDCDVSGNSAFSFGGGLNSVSGDITVSGSSFVGNSVKNTSGSSGSAICAEQSGNVYIGAGVTVRDSNAPVTHTFIYDMTTHPSAVYAAATVTVDDGTTGAATSPNILFENNTGWACDGVNGVIVSGNVTFRGNTAGAAKFSGGTVYFNGNVVAEGHPNQVFWANAVNITGGALRNNGGTDAGKGGGGRNGNGIFQGQSLTITDCEIYGNIYKGYGTIAFLTHGVKLTRCTVFDNQNLSEDRDRPEQNYEGSLGALIYMLTETRGGPGTVELYYSTFTDNYGKQCGVFRSFGAVTIEGCTFTDNRADYYGGAFVARGSNSGGNHISIKNSKFIRNTAEWYGAAFVGRNSEITKCLFEENVSDKSNGALFINSRPQIGKSVISDSTFLSNRANDGYGGAVYSVSGDVTFNNCVFESNEAWQGGAVIFLEDRQTGVSEINGCVFKENHAILDGYGGAISYGERGEHTIKNSFITDNGAGNWGGGVFIEGVAGGVLTLNINNTEISLNSAIRGGGIYSYSPSQCRVEINIGEESAIDGNKAPLPSNDPDYDGPGRGGGIYIEPGSLLTLNGGEIFGNAAATDGGGVYIEGAHYENIALPENKSVSFYGNTAAKAAVAAALPESLGTWLGAVERTSVDGSVFTGALKNAHNEFVDNGGNLANLLVFNNFDINMTSVDFFHTAFFETNGGTEIAPVVFQDGNSVPKPETPEKEGHIFAEWYSDADFTKTYDFETVPESDITLYAKWTPVYKITYDNNLTGAAHMTYVDPDIIYAGSYTLLTRAATGFVTPSGRSFAGWAETPGGAVISTATVTVGSDRTFYAVWRNNEITQPETSTAPEPTPSSEPTPTPGETPTPTPTPTAESPTPTPTPGAEPTPQPTPGGPIIVPGRPDIPPPPANPGATLVPEMTDDGEIFVEIGEDGVPLGEWRYEPEDEVWIYEPYIPLGEAPKTGDFGVAASWICVAASAGALLICGKRRRKAR